MAVSAVFCCSSSSAATSNPFLAAPRPPLILRSAAATVSASADKTRSLSLFPSSTFNTTLTPTANPRSLVVVKAARPDQNSKPISLVCADCDGNGAIQCTQCKGTAVNSVDHFNGQFKAGALCWLCRGKREILCGNCNGAGFVGGFLSTQDE